MLKTLRKFYSPQDTTAAKPVQQTEKVDMSVENNDAVAVLTASLAQVTEQLTAANGRVAELAEALQVAIAAKAETEKASLVAKLSSRKAKLVAAVGSVKAESVLEATNSMSDETFDIIYSAMKTSVDAEASSAPFKELGVDGNGDLTKTAADATNNGTMTYLKSQYPTK